jgi:oxygen-independent coproporphyrinogen-3 oxidase
VHLDFDDVLRADVIQQLMCPGSVHITAIERRYAIDFQDVLCGRARPPEAAGSRPTRRRR